VLNLTDRSWQLRLRGGNGHEHLRRPHDAVVQLIAGTQFAGDVAGGDVAARLLADCFVQVGIERPADRFEPPAVVLLEHGANCCATIFTPSSSPAELSLLPAASTARWRLSSTPSKSPTMRNAA
jgi:hypothetical protein